MTKPLHRVAPQLTGWRPGLMIGTPHPDLRGDCSGIRGSLHPDLRGDCSEILGDCSGLRGDCSGIRGNCSGIFGDLDQIPPAARPCNIADWVEEAHE